MIKQYNNPFVLEGLFLAWDGDYEKIFYDIKLLSGEVVEFCYPNAGKMLAIDGSGRMWSMKDKIKIRPSNKSPYKVLKEMSDG